MGGRSKQTFLQRRHLWPTVYETGLSITNHQRNSNKNHRGISHKVSKKWWSSRPTRDKWWRGCGEKGNSCTAGGNVNWCSHYGEQYGGSSKKIKIELPYDPAIPLVNIRTKWIVVAVQLLSHVWLFATPRTAGRQVSLSFSISHSLLKLMSIELVMPSNHLILCRPLLLLHSLFLSIRVFSNESALRLRWPKYWSVSFSIISSNGYMGLISLGLTGLISSKDSKAKRN